MDKFVYKLFTEASLKQEASFIFGTMLQIRFIPLILFLFASTNLSAQLDYYLLDGDTVYRNANQLEARPNNRVEYISYSSVAVNEQLKRLDSLTANLIFKEQWFEADSVVYNSIYINSSEIPLFNTQQVADKLSFIPSKVPLDYNPIVQDFIDKFVGERRHFIAKALGLSDHFFPIYEEVFDRENLPIELKYLSVIESGLDPKARSHMGATGPWQFMARTGRAYGLSVDSYIDERSDVYLATEAAARYLKDLYRIYDDWLLALAAYNAGPGNVNKAIALAGNNTSFWSIRPYLPKETQNYVPLYIACTYAMNYHDEYLIKPLKPKKDFFATDTVIINDKVSLQFICRTLGLDSAYIAAINPTLKTGIIPKNDYGFALHLPADYVSHFVANRSILTNDPTLIAEKHEVVTKAPPKYTVYRVRSGDTLGHIAERYNVGLSKIKKWNNLKSDFLKVGQKLVLYI